MADINFDCPHCGHNLEVSERGAGLTVACPECSKNIEIPIPAPELLVNDIVFNCRSCDHPLKASSDMAGQLIDCPACEKPTEIPFASHPSPFTPTRPTAGGTPVLNPPSQRQVPGFGTSNPAAPVATRPPKASYPGLVIAVICVAVFVGIFCLTSISGQSKTQSATSISSETIAAFEVKGVKLGMTTYNLRELFPSLEVSDDGRDGWVDDESNGVLRLHFASPPYGNGICFVHLRKKLGEIDEETFVTQFKTDLSAKYGKPTDEARIWDDYRTKDGKSFSKSEYRVCWGATHAFNQNFQDKSSPWPCEDWRNTCTLNEIARRGTVVNGNYLYARFINIYYTGIGRDRFIDIVLFDTSPYIKKAQAEKAKLIEASKINLDF